MAKPFSIETLEAIVKSLKLDDTFNDSTLTRAMLSPRAYHDDVYRELGNIPREYSPLSFGGIRVQPSNLFPFTQECVACGGTGEGVTSTYCPHCKGGGKVTHEGVMTSEPNYSRFHRSDRTVLLCSYFPKRFEPRADFTVPKPTMKGLA